ncbi:MAG: single-stranded-DNA-specific exonuclease RecJ [Steroidobacteraceae bacterium]
MSERARPLPRIRTRDSPGAGQSQAGGAPLLQRIFAARGVCSDAQLSLDLSALLPVSSLPGTEAAAQLLLAHRLRRVLVIGDFDVDGATSTALLLRGLRSFGFAQVDFAVPDRFRFGYGLQPAIVEHVLPRAPSLIVTVDNGVASVEGVARAKELGIEVLVTDHHLPGALLPDAQVIVNPNLADSSFGSRALAGVGVAFYVLAALRRLMQEQSLLPAGALALGQLLDLVALGTVADMVPLDANNRILVAQGLRRIRAGQCVPGIRALLELGQRELPQVVASDLGFAVAPRLNAAGRLDDMSLGIQCLLEDDPQRVAEIASDLDALNRQRREIESQMQGQALAAVRGLAARISDGQRHAGVCLYDPGWHQGAVGLVAGRVKDRLSRPVVAFAPADDGAWLRGSARSVPGVHIRDVFAAIATREPDLIERFGGHALAAGITLRAQCLDRFARAFEAEVAHWLQETAYEPAIWTDGALQDEELTLATARLLRDAAPWGQAFPEPSFDGEFDIESSRVLGEKHVKFWLRPAGSRLRLDAIAFNLLDPEQQPQAPAGRVRAVYRLDVNHYQGQQRLQLVIEHLQQG